MNTKNTNLEDIDLVPKDSVNTSIEEATPAEAVNRIDLPTAMTAIIARTEAISIAVTIINAFFDVIQAREDLKFTGEEITKIQAAINIENAKNDQLYREIDALLAEKQGDISKEAGDE